MASAATLAVSIVARIGDLTRGLGRAAGQVRGFGSTIASAARGIGILGGLTGGVGVAGLAALTKSSIDTLDSLSELTAITGLTANQLLAYRHAADLAGVGQEQFDTSLQRFAKVVGEAKTGTGALVTTLDKLIPGFSAAIAATTSQDQALRLVAQAYAATDDAAIRAVIATAAFGKTGVRLGEFLAGGAKGIEAATSALSKFGIGINDQDTANAAAAADAIDNLAFVLRNKLLVTVGKLAPFIAEAGNKLLDLASSSNFSSTALTSAFQTGVLGAARLADSFSLLKGLALGFKGTVEGAAGAILAIVEGLRRSIVSVLNLLPGFDIKPEGGLIDQLATDFGKAADKSFSAAGEALAAFSRGDAASATAKFFDDIQNRAKLAAAAASGTAAALGTVQDRAAATRAAKLQAADVGRALTIDLARTVIGGGAQGPRIQEVRSRQLETISELLRKGLPALAGSSVPVAG
ncbi:MAG: hypothetical protein ACRDFA_10940 [bacterium]